MILLLNRLERGLAKWFNARVETDSQLAQLGKENDSKESTRMCRLSSEWSSPLLPWSADAAKYVPPLESLIDKMGDSKALLPGHAMPTEPPAMHPRVAAQEGRFVIFGRTEDLLEEELRLEHKEDGTGIEELRIEQVRFQVADVEALLRDLAQLGVSRRALFPDLAGLADFVRWKHFHKVAGYKPLS